VCRFFVVFFLINFFIVDSLFLASNVSHEIFSMSIFQDQCRNELIKILPEQCNIRDVQYVVDGVYQVNDLSSLVGLSIKDNISKKDILNAVFYLKQLGLFSNVYVTMYQMDGNNYAIHFKCIQNILFDSIKISGFLRSKDRLKNIYIIDSGDIFDEQKHAYSLEQIKDSLQDQGYMQAQIYDSIMQSDDTKSVVVRCNVSKGSKFRIGQVTVSIDCLNEIESIFLQQLSLQIEFVCKKFLENKYYNAQLVQMVREKIKVILHKQDLTEVTIDIQTHIHPTNHNIDIAIAITIEKNREIVIWGNTFFSRDQIIEHLFLYGKSIRNFPSSIIIDEIEQLYKDKGFWNVQVSVREEQKKMFCFIQEGVRASLSSVKILNNQYALGLSIAQDVFKSCLKTKYIDRELLKKSLDLFIQRYKSEGFLDIKILKEEFLLNKKEQRYDYLLTIEEGSRRMMGSIIVPNYIDLEKQIIQKWPLGATIGFNKNILTDQKLWIIEWFKNKGYQKIFVEHELREHDDIVDIIWNVKPTGSVTKFGKTMLLGNSNVTYHDVLKELEYHEGDEWNKTSLEKTLKNLQEFHLFDSVQIYPGREVDEYGYKPIFLKLVQSNKYEVRTRFGLQQVGKNLQFRRGFTYKVGGSLMIKQCFSNIDRLSMYADVTRFYRDIGVEYNVPWLFGKRIRSQVKAYDVLYQQPIYIGSQHSLYKASQQGILWNVSRTVNALVLNGSVGIDFLALYEEHQPSLEKIICYDKNLLGEKIGFLFIEPTIMYRKVDSVLNPCKGMMFFLSCKSMFDFNNKNSFCKVLAEYTQYVSFMKDFVIVLRMRAGHIFNRYFQQIHPIDRFYLGGASSVRGYDRDYCPPLGLLTKPITDQHAGLASCAHDVWRYAPQGGRTMLNVNVELRRAMYKNFGIVLFSDLGILIQDSIQDVQCCSNNIFTGSGFGFRYDTPIGPLRFDVGFKWKIVHSDFESRAVWYLSLGQAF